jgi:hypothetical protein
MAWYLLLAKLFLEHCYVTMYVKGRELGVLEVATQRPRNLQTYLAYCICMAEVYHVETEKDT